MAAGEKNKYEGAEENSVKEGGESNQKIASKTG